MVIGEGSLPSKWNYETGVLVVGYGGAGAAAAIEAYDSGSTILIIEKTGMAGGTTAMAAGIIVGAGTSVQRARGITDSADN